MAHELDPLRSSMSALPGETHRDRLLAVVFRAVPLVLFFWMVGPLLVPVILGALFALILYPLQRRLKPKLAKGSRFAPVIVTTGALVLIVIPTVLIFIKAVGSINTFLARDWTQTVSDVQAWLNGRAGPYIERFHISPESIRTNVESL